MIAEQDIRQALRQSSLEPCAGDWLTQAAEILQNRPHGDHHRWMEVVADLAEVEGETAIYLDRPAITVQAATEVSNSVRNVLTDQLMALHPWRKGPFDLFGVAIDSEWRSDWKWQRIADRISPLQNRRVLDVGCGNGYYLYRMLGDGARLAVGIDPTQLFLAQFAAINHYVNATNAFILPMKSDEFSVNRLDPGERFDTVFSMGVYYHRKQPRDHLAELYQFLRPGGQLVVETLVIDNQEDTALEPGNRYAQMRNVWSLPSVARLTRQLENCGFRNPELIDLTATTTREQRSTSWMTFDSLRDFLDPLDPALTIEGYPGPLRACMIANRPEHPNT